MNIEKFIERRKQLGYSQSTLAKGICTQATISKFENGGKMISTKILTQLCQRLKLSLSDIFPSPSDQDAAILEQLHQAEFDLITMEYDEAFSILDQLNPDEMGNVETKMTYLFIKGYLLALSGRSTNDAVFMFDQILDGYDESHQTIYSKLAYVGLGLSYEQERNYERAEFYFSKMPGLLSPYQINDVSTVWKALTMMFYTGSYYSNRKNFEVGNRLLRDLIELSSQQHVSFYVARAKFKLAQNLDQQGSTVQVINEMLNEASVFAKFNHNRKLLSKIMAYQPQN